MRKWETVVPRSGMFWVHPLALCSLAVDCVSTASPSAEGEARSARRGSATRQSEWDEERCLIFTVGDLIKDTAAEKKSIMGGEDFRGKFLISSTNNMYCPLLCARHCYPLWGFGKDMYTHTHTHTHTHIYVQHL